MSESLTFVFPMPVNVTNSRRHWRTVHADKERLWERLDTLAEIGCLPRRVPSMPWDRFSVRSAMLLGGAMDDDNAVARHKSIMDWLKDRRYITDDRKKNLRWESFPEQRISRKEPASITLTITKQETPDGR